MFELPVYKIMGFFFLIFIQFFGFNPFLSNICFSLCNCPLIFTFRTVQNLMNWVLFSVAVMAPLMAAEPTVVVVGGGLAGLSASLEIITEGGRVILIEGENNTGGNSAKVKIVRFPIFIKTPRFIRHPVESMERELIRRKN